MSDIEVVYVTAARRTARDEQPKRRAVPYRPGDPLPRLGESVIIDFGEGAPARWIVQDIAHVIDGERRSIIFRLAAPLVP